MRRENREFYLFSTIMSLIMSGGMSLAMALLTGETMEALASWPAAWLVSFLVALPLSIVVVPFTQRLVTLICDGHSNKSK